MILSITLNPSIDISYPLEHLKINTTNRPLATSKTPGGKGLNVTRVAAQLKHPVIATGFLGGKLGEWINEQLLHLDYVTPDFFPIAGETRNCIAILHDDGQQTEILEAGPEISEQEAKGFLTHIEKIFNEQSINIVTISGSLPKGLANDYYKQIIQLANKFAIPTILDVSGKPLDAILNGEVKPFAIKPNDEELCAIEGIPSTRDLKILKDILSKDLYKGIPLILVSLGKDGAFVRYDGQFYKVSIPHLDVVNPVGSGDSTVAGLAVATAQDALIEAIVKTAMTTGMLNAMEKATGCINPALFDSYYEKVIVEKL